MIKQKRCFNLKQLVHSDAAVFRRGFYSCPEEHREEGNEYSEMAREISPQSRQVSKKEIFRKRRIRKKIKLIRKSLRKAQKKRLATKDHRL